MKRNIEIPECCGRTMNIILDLGKFLEAHCNICNEVVYIRKSEAPKPQLISD